MLWLCDACDGLVAVPDGKLCPLCGACNTLSLDTSDGCEPMYDCDFDVSADWPWPAPPPKPAGATTKPYLKALSGKGFGTPASTSTKVST